MDEKDLKIIIQLIYNRKSFNIESIEIIDINDIKEKAIKEFKIEGPIKLYYIDKNKQKIEIYSFTDIINNIEETTSESIKISLFIEMDNISLNNNNINEKYNQQIMGHPECIQYFEEKFKIMNNKVNQIEEELKDKNNEIKNLKNRITFLEYEVKELKKLKQNENKNEIKQDKDIDINDIKNSYNLNDIPDETIRQELENNNNNIEKTVLELSLSKRDK